MNRNILPEAHTRKWLWLAVALLALAPLAGLAQQAAGSSDGAACADNRSHAGRHSRTRSATAPSTANRAAASPPGLALRIPNRLPVMVQGSLTPSGRPRLTQIK